MHTALQPVVSSQRTATSFSPLRQPRRRGSPFRLVPHVKLSVHHDECPPPPPLHAGGACGLRVLLGPSTLSSLRTRAGSLKARKPPNGQGAGTGQWLIAFDTCSQSVCALLSLSADHPAWSWSMCHSGCTLHIISAPAPPHRLARVSGPTSLHN
jgi:hypothetical protein